MWAQYAQRGSGIVIRSTFARLVDSLAEWEQATYVGCVRYVDFDTTSMGSANLLTPFIHKRREFAADRELRVVISQTPASQQEGVSVLDHSVSLPDGVLAPIKVPTLVERVVFAPGAPEWHIEAIRTVMSALGYDIPVAQSSLDREALLG